MSIKTLVLDDEQPWRTQLSRILEREGHTVTAVETLDQARTELSRDRFHLAVVDIVLTGDIVPEGGESGLDLAEDISRLSNDPDRLCAPVVLTGNPSIEEAVRALQKGASFDFLGRAKEPIVLKRSEQGTGFRKSDFLDVCRRVLRQVLLARSRLYEQNQYTLFLDLAPKKVTSAQLRGPINFLVEGGEALGLDIDEFAGRADDLQFRFSASNRAERDKWRPRAQQIGRSLYTEIFAKDAQLTGGLVNAQTRSGRRPLHLVFRGAQDLIRLPLELLAGEIGYLIMESPLVRQIANISAADRRGIGRVFFDETPEIKVLLIGSNTDPAIPGADQEIEKLSETLPKFFSSRGFACKVDAVPTKDATYDRVYGYLDRCQYHIVHYAGHGYHDERLSDESGIAFWTQPNRSGDVRPMPIRILRHLLRFSDVRFFYLSCCVGAKSAPPDSVKLSGSDFQGIVEGLVRIGIPSVLGYRWNVWDTEAKHLALSFYENLLTDLGLDLALFKARRALQEASYYNETWASPILVTQST